jgi:hypothetical protein
MSGHPCLNGLSATTDVVVDALLPEGTEVLVCGHGADEGEHVLMDAEDDEPPIILCDSCVEEWFSVPEEPVLYRIFLDHDISRFE